MVYRPGKSIREAALRPIRAAAVGLALACSACSTWLPTSADSIQAPWVEFDDARRSVERIEPQRTQRSELVADGFDPYRNPAVTILSWPDLLQRFASAHAVNGNELDHGLLICLRAGHRCSGFAVNVRKTRRERIGNFWVDSLAFRREVLVTGWTFNALIVFVDDVVVYRAFGGQPRLEEFSVTRNPLGPLQGWGDSLGATLIR